MKSSLPWSGDAPASLVVVAPQPERSAAVPSSAARSGAIAALRRVPRIDRLNGLGAGCVDREDLVESRDLEDLRDVPVAADERDLAAVRAEPLDAPDQHAEGRRVDE